MPTRLNGPIIKLDLLQPSHLQLVKDLINNRACQYVHFAPPCGTASRARLIQNGDRPMPPTLRNDDHPNGLPWLTTDQASLGSPAGLCGFACWVGGWDICLETSMDYGSLVWRFALFPWILQFTI